MELIQEKQIIPENNKEKKQSKTKNFKYELWDNIKTFGITIILTLLVINYVAQLSMVKGESMANTLHDSNIVLMEKITQRFGNLKRYDVVIFNTDIPEKPHYIKRIIGLPGETVRIDGLGNIFINGEQIEEYYGREVIEDPGTAIKKITLADDEYFVLGDNRNNSIDSRFTQVGTVKKDKIEGHVIISLSPFSTVDKQQRLQEQ